MAMVLIGLLPLLFSVFITYYEEQRTIRDTIGRDFQQIAIEAAGKVELQVTQKISEARQLATIPIVRTAVIDANRSYTGRPLPAIRRMVREWEGRWNARKHPDRFPDFVNKMATDYLIDWIRIRKGEYISILVADSQGALVVSSSPRAEYDQSKKVWWQASYNGGVGQIYVSDLAFDPQLGYYVLEVSAPIMDDTQQKAVGAVNMRLMPNELFKAIQEVRLGERGHAMLLNSAGKPLICPILSPDRHTLNAALMSQIAQPRAGWVIAEDDGHGGRDAIVGFAPVRFQTPLAEQSLGGGGVRWIGFVRQDPTETYAPLRQLLEKVSAGAVGVFLLMLLGGRFLARRIVRPIQVLEQRAALIGQGDLDQRLEINSGDEIEKLADAFNQMASSLGRSFQELEHQMAEIRRLEERYRDLIENSPEMILQLDQDGGFVHINTTAIEKLGYTQVDVAQKKLWEIVPEECRETVRHYLLRLKSEEGSLETVFLTQAGGRLDVEIHTTVLFDQGSGSLVYTRAFVRDITARKTLEAEVRRHTEGLEQEVTRRTKDLVESQERYKILFDEAADSVLMVNPDGDIVAVNRRQETVLRYPEEQLAGRRFLELVLPKDQAAVAALMKEIVGGARKTPTVEVKIFDRAGRPVPMELDLTSIQAGARTFLLVQLRDITERKRLERELQEYSEALELKVMERTREIADTKTYLENLLENANDVIYTLDLDQRFTYVNSKIEIWGYRKDDLLGRPYLSLMSRRHRGKRLRATLDIGTKQAYEVELLTGDGELRTALVSVSPLRDNNGAIVGVLGIARDITEKKQLEQQVLNAEKLASVGKLSAGVAHEINNPLGGILNCLYNLRKGTISPERQSEYLVSMEDGLQRVQKIVRQLLDFSQQHDPELSQTEVNPLIERVLALTKYAFERTGVRLNRELARELPPLMADGHMIEQVVMNLILNAVQAIRGDGAVTVRSRKDEIFCVIEVEDNGSGIATDVLPKIFDPFFTTKGQGEGTGLGLSVSLGIVQRHGGEIQVRSQVGKGTLFTVRLPAVHVRVPVGREA
ncbi:MAG TPA: PAS domain S-box protein [Nitrospirales bacterium]